MSSLDGTALRPSDHPESGAEPGGAVCSSSTIARPPPSSPVTTILPAAARLRLAREARRPVDADSQPHVQPHALLTWVAARAGSAGVVLAGTLSRHPNTTPLTPRACRRVPIACGSGGRCLCGLHGPAAGSAGIVRARTLARHPNTTPPTPRASPLPVAKTDMWIFGWCRRRKYLGAGGL